MVLTNATYNLLFSALSLFVHWSKLSYTLSGVKQNMLYIQCPLWNFSTFFLCDQLNFQARKCCSLSSCCIFMGLSLHVSFCSDVPVPGVMYRHVDPALSLRRAHSWVPISVSFPELHDHWYECCLRVWAWFSSSYPHWEAQSARLLEWQHR